MKAVNLDPEDPQVRVAVFGERVQEFLRSEIGAFLLRKAEADLANQIDELKRANVGNSNHIIRLQVRIELLEKFEGWLGDAVQEGLTAIAIIDGEGERAED